MKPARGPLCWSLCLMLSGRLYAAELVAPDLTIEQAIDHYLQARLTERQITPVPVADDCTLIRRTSLDLQGRIPTVAEARQYVESTEADKRLKMVDRLLAAPDFAYQ